MINLYRKYKLHARQPLGMSSPGIGPGSDATRVRRQRAAVDSHWHPAHADATAIHQPELCKSLLFSAWATAKKVSRSQTP